MSELNFTIHTCHGFINILRPYFTCSFKFGLMNFPIWLRSPRHQGVSPSGRLAIRASRHQGVSPSGRLAIRASRHQGVSPSGRLAIRASRHQPSRHHGNELATNELATKLSQLATKIQYKVDYELKLAVFNAQAAFFISFHLCFQHNRGRYLLMTCSFLPCFKRDTSELLYDVICSLIATAVLKYTSNYFGYPFGFRGHLIRPTQYKFSEFKQSSDFGSLFDLGGELT